MLYRSGVWLVTSDDLPLSQLDMRYIASSPVVTLTDALTVAVNAALGNDFRLLMTSGVGATRALGAPSNPVDGRKIIFQVTQDSAGSRLLTMPAAPAATSSLPSRPRCCLQART